MFKALQVTAITVVFVLFVECRTIAWGAEAPIVDEKNGVAGGLRLTAQTRADTFAVCEPIILDIALKNGTKKQIFSFVTTPELMFSINVNNERNETVPLTSYGKQLKSSFSISTARLPIEAGEEEHIQILLNRVVELTSTGVYSVEITRRVPNVDGTNDGTNVSARLQIRVVEPRLENRKVIPSKQPPVPVEANKTALPVAQWHEGDTWNLAVDLLLAGRDPANEPSVAPDKTRLLVYYEMQVKIAGTDTANDGAECWQVDFIPSKEAPSSVLSQAYRVLVGKRDGLAHMIIGLKGYGNHLVEKIGPDDILATRDAPFGYPIEFFPMSLEKPVTGKPLNGSWTFELSNRIEDGQKVIESKCVKDEVTTTAVKQTWDAGARWWSRYEKQDLRRQMVLRVRPIERPPAK